MTGARADIRYAGKLIVGPGGTAWIADDWHCLTTGRFCVAGTPCPSVLREKEMKKSLLLAVTVAALALGAGPAMAKKQLVIVVKGLDNPFFEAINQGCQKWNSGKRQLGI